MTPHSIRTRLLLAFLGLAFLPQLLTGGLLVWQSYRTHVNEIYAHERDLAARVEVELDAFFRDVETRLASVNLVRDFAKLGQQEQTRILSVLQSERYFREITLMDAAGRERVRLSTAEIVSPKELRDMSETEAFRRPMENGRTYSGPIHYDPNTGEPLMILAVPFIEHRSGRVEAVLAAEVRVRRLWELVAAPSLAKGQSVYVIDGQRRVIAHRNPSVVLRETTLPENVTMGLGPGLSGNWVYGVMRKFSVAQQPFTIVAEYAVAEALVPAEKAIASIVTIVLLSLTTAFLLFRYAVRQIIQPIEAVSSAAKAVRSGDLSRRVNVTSPDELGELAASFNAMTQELQSAMADLQRNEANMRALIEGSPLPMLVAEGPEEKVVFVNRRFSEVIGYNIDEMPDVAHWWPLAYPDEGYRRQVQQAWVDRFKRAIAEHTAVEPTEARVVCKGGEIRDFEVHLNDIGPWHLVVFVDLTERVRAENALRQLSETLERRVQEEVAKGREKDLMLIQQSRLAAMGEMVHNIAHQWRQPLNALSIVINNIRDDYEFGELTRESLKEAVTKSRQLLQNMSNTIDDFRNFFRPDREAAEFDVAKAVREAASVMEASLRNNAIELDMALPAGVVAVGFPSQFSQSVLNLIVNAKEAIQGRHPGAGRIMVMLVREDNDAVLTVEDNGGGIPMDILPKIFDPYFSTKEQGSGIGLYMTKMIMEKNMGGSVRAENIPGGARFILRIPLLQVSTAA